MSQSQRTRVRVLIAEELPAEALEILRSAGLDVNERAGLDRAGLEAAVADCDILVVGEISTVDRTVIEKADKLRLIGRAGLNVDNVDVEAATERGIIVMNSPRGNAVAAAEHTLALMFALARKVALADSSMKQGRWDKDAFTGVEVSGKSLGVIGFGKVGRIVAEKARALGMEVLVHDPLVVAEEAAAIGAETCSLGALLKQSDFIAIHCPLNGRTRHLLKRETLSKVKKGAFVINVSRGGIIDEDALYEALEKGLIAGAALDVFETEPPDKKDRLVRSDRVIATPHVGGSTLEAQRKAAVDMANQIVDYVQKGVMANSINIPAASFETLRAVAPYTTLAERLALFVSLISEGPIREIEIEYRGTIAEVETTMLTREIIARILSSRAGVSPGKINAVNALTRMKSLGIVTREFKEVLHYYPTSLLIIRLKGDRGEAAAYGTLLKENEARLIRVNNISVDADLTGKMLLVYSYDRPGLIGRVASRLTEEGINIGEMHFGRERVGGLSLTIFDLDHAIGEQTIEVLRSLPDVVAAKGIELP